MRHVLNLDKIGHCEWQRSKWSSIESTEWSWTNGQ